MRKIVKSLIIIFLVSDVAIIGILVWPFAAHKFFATPTPVHVRLHNFTQQEFVVHLSVYNEEGWQLEKIVIPALGKDSYGATDYRHRFTGQFKELLLITELIGDSSGRTILPKNVVFWPGSEGIAACGEAICIDMGIQESDGVFSVRFAPLTDALGFSAPSAQQS